MLLCSFILRYNLFIDHSICADDLIYHELCLTFFCFLKFSKFFMVDDFGNQPIQLFYTVR